MATTNTQPRRPPASTIRARAGPACQSLAVIFRQNDGGPARFAEPNRANGDTETWNRGATA
jgi:hypothetical protein